MTVLMLGGIGFGTIILIVLLVCLKGEIDYRHIVKKANEYEAERKKQGKSVDEWYGHSE